MPSMLDELVYTWAPWIFNGLSECLTRANRIATVVYREVQNKNTWIFLHEQTVTLSTQSFLDSGIPDESIRWRCSFASGKPTFTSVYTASTGVKYEHLPYLAITVSMNSVETFDISEWMNDVQWNGPVEPTLKDIVTLWSCQKGICLFHHYKSIRITAITSAGDCVEKGLNESPPTNTYERDNRNSGADGQDPNRIMDIVLSSSGR